MKNGDVQVAAFFCRIDVVATASGLGPVIDARQPEQRSARRAAPRTAGCGSPPRRRGGRSGPTGRPTGAAASAARATRASGRGRTGSRSATTGRTDRGSATAPDGAGEQPDDAHDQRPLLKARQRRHVGGHCVCVHLGPKRSSAGASPPWPRRRCRRRDLGRVAARHVGRRRVLAQLQRADVGDDRPAIARRDLRPVVRHRAEAVGHHVEEVADRRPVRSRSMWNDGGCR